MIVIIQCAGSKRRGAGSFELPDGRPVVFVDDPQAAPTEPARVYAHPDDRSSSGTSWRQMLLNYNRHPHDNPLGLLPAYQLYENQIYQQLVERLGVEHVYVLSAGWGLIRADFLTPYYDITFSPSAEQYKRRKQSGPSYQDFRMLPKSTEDDVVFFGGKSYLPLFSALTNVLKCQKAVLYNSRQAPTLSGCTMIRFETTTRTNWHYECAKAFLDGRVTIRGFRDGGY